MLIHQRGVIIGGNQAHLCVLSTLSANRPKIPRKLLQTGAHCYSQRTRNRVHFKGARAIIEPYSLLEKLIVHAHCVNICIYVYVREAEHIVSRFINFLLARAAPTIFNFPKVGARDSMIETNISLHLYFKSGVIYSFV